MFAQRQNRRSFLRAGAATAATVAAVTAAGPAAAASPNAQGGRVQVPHSDIEELTIAEMAAAMESGKVSSRRLVANYLSRIRRIDRGRVDLRSIIEVNPEALDIAHQLDQERADGQVRGPCMASPSSSRPTSTPTTGCRPPPAR